MLDVKNIDAFYGEFQVLREVSIRVAEGELIMVLGPNGHGKSTLLKTICGLIKPASGTISFRDQNIGGLPAEKIVQMGVTYIAEERELFAEMSVLENLKLGAYNKNARQKEAENLEYVYQLFPRLTQMKKRNASTLSGGEAKMLAIARGLMSNAVVLAVDEPSLGLAPIVRTDVFNKLGDINRDGRTILLVEQNIPQVSDIASRIYLMEEGEIVFEGSKDEALNNEEIKKVFLGM